MKKIFILMWLASFALLFLPGGARASSCNFTSGSLTTLTFSMPRIISVPGTMGYGDAVGNTVTVTNPGTASLICNPLVTNNPTIDNAGWGGMHNMIGATVNLNYFPTNIQGVAWTIASPDLLDRGYPNFCCWAPSGDSRTVSSYFGTQYTLRLFSTGGRMGSGTIPAGVIGYFEAGGVYVVAVSLANPITINATPIGCTVNTKSISVTLPPQSIGVQGGIGGNAGIGATAGRTPFTIALACTGGATASIQLDYGGTYTGIPGVLSNKGTAPGVGVQILDKNATPVNFGTKALVGATPNGSWNLGYYAQYYRMGAMAPGTVSASATFTMTYQ